jgi:hypothetical protein
MSSSEQRAAGPAQRSVEIGVVIATAIFAAIVIYGSLRAGIGWGAEGPMAGFFPFYVGIIIAVASAANLMQVWPTSQRPRFAEWGQLRQVALVLIPTIVYVALIPPAGIYVSSALLIAFFMKWLGRYGAGMTAAVAIGVPLATFLVFERWFLVPLPKGPLEAALGY